MHRLCTYLPVLVLALPACSTNGRTQSNTGTDSATASASGTETGPTSASATASDSDSATGGQKFDVGAGETETGGDATGGCPPINGDATLTGTVLAPNGTLPISGAAVYFSDSPPDQIPQTVFCEECIELSCDVPAVLTEPDGSFSLDLHAGSGYLVVRKGQFMRVTALDVAPGSTPVNEASTTLPGQNDPNAGAFIPRIAVALGDHDHIETALAKLGLGETSITNYDEELVEGTEPFDVWDNAPGRDFTGSKGSADQLFQTPALLEQYHIIFAPCTMQADEYPAILDDPAVRKNIQDWVAKGGKLYVSDWAGEFIDMPFPQYQDFWLRSDSTTVDQWQGQDTLDLGRYDPVATVLDPDLLAWLTALPPEHKDINPVNDPQEDPLPTLGMLPKFQSMFVYSGIKDTPPVMVDDGMGGMVDVGHKTWIEAPGTETWGVPPPDETHPLTITGEYGCGRIMFTGYHTVEGRNYVGLTPQELVLMYLILEIGVCQTPYDPPPPEG